MRVIFAIAFFGLTVLSLNNCHFLTHFHDNTTCKLCDEILCLTCPQSSSQCTECTDQFYLQGSKCIKCQQNCKVCNSTTCTECIDGYSINRGKCVKCSISNVKTCQNINDVKQCLETYYAFKEESCQLCDIAKNCKTCSAQQKCTSCYQGQGLKEQQNQIAYCQKLHQDTHCLQCSLVASSKIYSNKFLRQVLNCTFCGLCQANYQEINKICSKKQIQNDCQFGYYYSESQNKCKQGGSILCGQGGRGKQFYECIRKCAQYSFKVQKSSPQQVFMCIPRIKYNGKSVIYLNANQNANQFIPNQSQTFFGFTVIKGFKIQLQKQIDPFYQLQIYFRVIGSSSFNFNLKIQDNSSVPKVQTLDLSASNAKVYKYQTKNVTQRKVKLTFTSETQIGVSQVLFLSKGCIQNCLKCPNSLFCQICKQDYNLQNRCVKQEECQGYYKVTDPIYLKRCISNCPQKTYIDQDSKLCQKCQQPCLTCTSEQRCLSCVQNLYFNNINKTCADDCENQLFYKRDSSMTCERCIVPCLRCSNIQDCISCTDFFLNISNKRCVSACGDGWFGNSTVKQCQKCQDNTKFSNCVKCSQNQCTQCQDNYFKYKQKCVINCQNKPGVYFQINNQIKTCTQCLQGCNDCQPKINSSASYQCTKCSIGYFLQQKKCQRNCPEGFYGDVRKNSCQNCSSNTNCTKCLSQRSCTQCKSGYFLKDAQCISQEDCIKQKKNYVTLNQCKPCESQCSTCENQNQCLTCSFGYLQNKKCLSRCPQKYYPDSQECKECTNCLTCISQSICLTCKDGQFLTSNSRCDTSCSQGYYKDINKCALCLAPCISCDTKYNCLKCNKNYTLSKGNCINICKNGQIRIDDSDGYGICQQCSQNCRWCVNTKDQCSSCNDPNYLSDKQCVKDCPKQFYKNNANRNCIKCQHPCQECKGLFECTSCKTGVLQGTQCGQCPQGTYQKNNSCLICQKNCSSCLNATYCISCIQEHYLTQQRTCKKVCPDSTFKGNNGKCSFCSLPCKTCNNQNCLSCAIGFFHINKCQSKCPSGFYGSVNTCVECNKQKCLQCIDQGTKCTSCNQSTFLRINQCVDDCNKDKCTDKQLCYYKNANDVCISCRYPCKSCSSTNCLSCVTGLFFYNESKICLLICPSGYYGDTNGTCGECDDSCLQCDGKQINNCTRCGLISSSQSYLTIDNKCTTDCQEGYFSDNSSKRCIKCVLPCNECLSLIKCSTCHEDYILFQKDCYSSCPQGYYQSSKDGTRQCTKCTSKNCQACQNDQSCSICVINYYKNRQNQCIQNCTQEIIDQVVTYYYNDYKTRQCVECSKACKQCVGSAINCSSCYPKYKLIQQTLQKKYCLQTDVCPQQTFLHPNENQCVLECPVEQDKIYYRNPINHKCVQLCNSTQFTYFKREKDCVKSNSILLDCQKDQYGNASFVCYSCLNISETADCKRPLTFQLEHQQDFSRLTIRIEFNQQIQYDQNLTKQDIKLQFQELQKRRMLQIKTPQFSIEQKRKKMIILAVHPQTIGQTIIKIQLPLLKIRAKDYIPPSSGLLHTRNQQLRLPFYTSYQAQSIQQGEQKIYTASLVITTILLLLSLIPIFFSLGHSTRHISDMLSIGWIIGYVSLGEVVNIEGWIRGFRGGIFGALYGFLNFGVEGESKLYGRFSVINQDVMFLKNADFLLIILIIFIAIGITTKILIHYFAHKQKKINSVHVEIVSDNVIVNQHQQIRSLGVESKNSQVIKRQIKNQQPQVQPQVQPFFQVHNTQLIWVNILHDLIYTIYLPLFFYSIGQFTDISTSQPSNNLSSIIAFIIFFVLLLIPILLIIYVYMKLQELLNRKGLPTIVRSMTGEPGIWMIVLRYVRIITIAFLALLCMQFPKYTLGMICILCVCFSLLILAYKPYRCRIQGYLIFSCELLMVFKCLLISILTIFTQLTNSTKLSIGWVAIVVSVILLIILYIYVIVTIVLLIYGFFKKRDMFLEQYLRDQVQNDNQDINSQNESKASAHGNTVEENVNMLIDKLKINDIQSKIQKNSSKMQLRKMKSQAFIKPKTKQDQHNFQAYQEQDDQFNKYSKSIAPQLLIKCSKGQQNPKVSQFKQ